MVDIRIIDSEKYNWTSIKVENCKIFFKGDDWVLSSLKKTIRLSNIFSAKTLNNFLKKNIGHFAFIIKRDTELVAVVDHCRSIPLFFTNSVSSFTISNSANTLLENLFEPTIDSVSALEFSMSGYVTEDRTIYKNINQIESGKWLWINESSQLKIFQYYNYLPVFNNTFSEKTLIKELGNAMDQSIDRVIKKAQGRPIWVPLSAGLDSRIILCKLHQKKYTNLYAFSYGPNGNDEAREAKKICKKIDIVWTFFHIKRSDMKFFFKSKDRIDYWNFSDNLSSLPNFQDLIPLWLLKIRNNLDKDIIVVNGQTGDFISGGHIPKALMEYKGLNYKECLLNAIIDKHYSLWNSLKTKKNIKRVKELLNSKLNLNKTMKRDEAIAYYEIWEYQERQSKYVINGQRNYEFLGIDWALPLWDKEFVEFWKKVPYDLKFKQKLFKNYLNDYDYMGLFNNYHTKVWQWPGLMKIVLPLFRLVRLTFGHKYRDKLVKVLLYFGMYRDQYAAFSFRYYISNLNDFRSPISFLSEYWLREKKIKNNRYNKL